MANLDLISVNKAPFARVEPFYRKIGGEGCKVLQEYADPTRTVAEDYSALLLNAENVSRAAIECAKMFDAKRPPAEAVVYVITNTEQTHSKIGVTKHPLRRLNHLQSGNWKRLHIAGLCWMMQGTPYGVEQLSLRVAKKMGTRVSGEWLEAGPAEAAFVVASVALSANVKTADSGMWLRNQEYAAAHATEQMAA